ncbi:MAG TPA: hypothetical protein C5S37_05855 [Methanophagales archaeon]|nr:hypothetical protein [Methanophagales archaeon]
MGIKDSFEKAILDKRTLAVIVAAAILWRAFISLDREIALWESMCSGIVLILFGWILFAYMCLKPKKLKGWIMSNWIYQGIAVSMVSINVYVVIYYAMRWHRLLHVEAYLPLDFIFRDIRYLMLVVFYCGVIWSAKYVKKMHEDYVLLSHEKGLLHLISPYLYLKGKKLREMGVKELMSTVITDERTLMVIVGIAFLWRTIISIDFNITIQESMCSGIALFIMGWFFFGYIYSMPRKQKGWPNLVKVYRGIASGLLAINIYVLVYYGMRWYRLIGVGGVAEAFVPLDYLFRDARFFALVMFYCASIVLSKFLKRAYEEYRLLSSGAKTI